MEQHLVEPPRKAVVGRPAPVWSQDRYCLIEALKRTGAVNVSAAKVWCVVMYLENRRIDYALTKKGNRYIVTQA